LLCEYSFVILGECQPRSLPPRLAPYYNAPFQWTKLPRLSTSLTLSLSFGLADQSQLAFSHSPRLLFLALQLPSFWLTGVTAGFRTSAGLSTEFSIQLHPHNLSYENHNQSVTMGCGMSTEEKEGKQRNEEIENQLKRDKMMQRNEIKMLLLGWCLRDACMHELSKLTVS
jgi:hypothetical protein